MNDVPGVIDGWQLRGSGDGARPAPCVGSRRPLVSN